MLGLRKTYKFRKDELEEFRALHSLVKHERYKLKLVEGNTALVTGGQKWVKFQESFVKLLESNLDAELSRIARANGIEGKIEINLERGFIKEVKDKKE